MVPACPCHRNCRWRTYRFRTNPCLHPAAALAPTPGPRSSTSPFRRPIRDGRSGSGGCECHHRDRLGNVPPAGCGSGYYGVILKKYGAVPFGVDLSENMIRFLRQHGIRGSVGNIEDIQLHKTFDKILAAGVLEFVANPERAIHNLTSHLKKKGTLVILYPRYSIGGILYKCYHLLHGINIHLFTAESIKKKLLCAGLTVNIHKHVDPIVSVIKAVKT